MDDINDFSWRRKYCGKQTKETGIIHWMERNDDATNESGFTALPCGYRTGFNKLIGSSFEPYGRIGIWWSSTESSAASGWTRSAYFFNITAVDRSSNNSK